MTFPIPKQARALLADQISLYNTTGGVVTEQFAAHNLTLLPPIPSGSVIHDNACGPGTVSRLLLASANPPSNITIQATDIDPVFLSALEADVEKNSWPVQVSNQRLENLSFENEYFTHSFTNIGIIFASAAGLDGAREIHRTLKSGGVAVVNCWKSITWLLPFLATAAATRPGAPFPRPSVDWNDGLHLQQIMVEAGFERENMRVEQSEAWAKTSDLKSWAEKSWAFLRGHQEGWTEEDEERWEEAVDTFVKALRVHEGTKEVDGEVWMRASQWVVIATK